MARKSRKPGRKQEKRFESKFNRREQLARERHKTQKKQRGIINKIKKFFGKQLNPRKLLPHFVFLISCLFFAEHVVSIMGAIIFYREYYSVGYNIAKEIFK